MYRQPGKHTAWWGQRSQGTQGPIGVLVLEQVQVERKIKKGQVRPDGGLLVCWGDWKVTRNCFSPSVWNLRPLTSLLFRYQNGRKLGLDIFLLSEKKKKEKRMLSGLLPFFIFLTLWCVSSYILLVDKGLRYVTKWWPKWKWNQAGFTLNSTLSSIYLRWVPSFKFLHTGDDWNHCFLFQLSAHRLFIHKRRIKDWTHTMLISLWWPATVNVPAFKDDLKPK